MKKRIMFSLIITLFFLGGCTKEDIAEELEDISDIVEIGGDVLDRAADALDNVADMLTEESNK